MRCQHITQLQAYRSSRNPLLYSVIVEHCLLPAQTLIHESVAINVDCINNQNWSCNQMRTTETNLATAFAAKWAEYPPLIPQEKESFHLLAIQCSLGLSSSLICPLGVQ